MAPIARDITNQSYAPNTPLRQALRWFLSKKNLTCIVHETWYTDVTSQEDDKKVIKSGGASARLHVIMLTNTAI